MQALLAVIAWRAHGAYFPSLDIQQTWQAPLLQ